MSEKLTEKQQLDFSSALSYMKTAKLILRDLEKENQTQNFFNKYKKEDINKWLENPAKNENKLVEVSCYFYNISQHYRRLCNHFGKMSTLDYICLPYKLDDENLDVDKFKKSYKKAIDKLDVMNIKSEFAKVINTMFREDVFYGYEYSTNDSYFIKKMPYRYCEITSIIDGVFSYQFNFAYFDRYPLKLAMYGAEFVEKYELYKTDKKKYQWQDLDHRKSFALKLNDDVDFVIPPFCSLIPLIFDIEDVKQLDRSKKEMDNYKLLLMELKLDDDGNFIGDFEEAKKYYNMLSNVLPSNIGLGMSPWSIKDYTFERSGKTTEVSDYANAQKDFWDNAGVNGSIFSSESSTAAAISSGLNSDQALIFNIHRMIERVINGMLKLDSGKYKFKVNILDVTIFNKKEYLDNLLKAATYGAPVKLAITSVLSGYTPADTYGMTVLENVLDVVNNWHVLQSTNTQNTGETTNTGGRPTVDDDKLTDAGEQARDDSRKI